jgi:PAS domain S-box-containing protein
VPFGVAATLASLTESVMSLNSLGTPRGKALVVMRPGHAELAPGGSASTDPQAEQPERSSMLNGAMYESFFSLSIDMLCVAGYDGFFKHLNSAWTQTLGFTDAELMARPFLDFVHPDDRLATIAVVEKLAKGAKIVNFRNRYECRDGTYRWLAWTAIPAVSAGMIHAVGRDVTQEVRAEAELKEASLSAATRLALLTALLDAIGVGVVLVDREHVVAHWNQEASRLTGIPVEQALGQPMRQLGELFAPRVEDYPGLQPHFERASRLPVESFRFAMLILEPRREIEITVSPAVLTPDRRQVGFVMALHDITAARDLDRAKDELIATVSHELRTPLASLVGFTELLLARKFSEAQRQQYLETMLHEGRRLAELINDFLDLQRMEGGYKWLDLGPADLQTLVTRAVTTAGNDPRTPIEVEVPKDLPLVMADTNAILQVLINLLSNARKYSPAGGVIRVDARVIGDAIQVSIQDHGLGIPPEALPKLFNKFYRIANADRRLISGTGLGLAICRRIVDAHGGQVGVASEGPGQGSRFYFTLRAASHDAKSGDVLLVEDDSGFARLLEAELTTKGLSSVWAPDAETADRLIGQMTARAVVLDLLLPGAQGEDFLARLRTSGGGQLPVVVVTTKELEATETLALRTAGVVAVLKKHSGVAKEAADFIADALTPRKAP